jgi:ketosteroid isomerase-like protein
MIKMKKIFSVSILFLLFSTANFAQSKAEKSVAEAVENFRKLMVDPNKAAMESMICTELTYGHSSGKVENKAECIEALVSGKSDFLKINLSEQTIQVVGKTAIVRHILNADSHDAGKDPSTVKLKIMTVWQKQGGKWKLLARQAVKIQ